MAALESRRASRSICPSFSRWPLNRSPSIFRSPTTFAPPAPASQRQTSRSMPPANLSSKTTISTYVTLDNAQRRKKTLAEIGGIAGRLQQISEDRFGRRRGPA